MNPHLLLAYDFPPIGGGIARWMGELAYCYPERSLIVSTGTHEGSAEVDATFPVTIDRVGVAARRLRTFTGQVRWSLRAGALARARDVEFSWCGNIRPAGYPSRWLKRWSGIPYGVILYGGDLLTTQAQARTSARKRRVAQKTLADAALLVTISEFSRDLTREVLSELGLPHVADRVVVVPLGTDPARFHPGVDPAPARDRFGLGAGRWLLTVARLTPHKGIDTGLRVLARLALRYPDLHYAVAGHGGDRARLEQLAAALGVAHRVHWLGPVGDDLLPSLYCGASVYLGLSRRDGVDVEGFGISMVEASGSGVPVIGGRSGGVPDAVREGETGLLVDPTSVDEIAEVTARFLDDPSFAARIGAAGRKAVEQYYNWGRVAKDLRRLGDEVSAALRVPAR